MVINMMDWLLQYKNGNESTLLVFFYLIDFLIIFAQFRLIDNIWTKKKHVQEFEVTILMMVIFFNPL